MTELSTHPGFSLGGPGVACSAMRVRRFEAGELFGDEAARTESHLVVCARCQATQRELVRERALLARDLPFEELAVGVAKRLTRPRPARRPARFLGLAIAAGLAAAVAVPAWYRLRAPSDDGVRLKGGAEVTVYARGGATALPLQPGEPVPAGAALRLGLAPAGRKFVAVALLDADGAAILFSGPAKAGLLPGAFEWTGSGDGTLVAILSDQPIDASAFAHRLARDGTRAASPDGRAEVIVRSLRRGGR
jgi:hypothetical protein